MFAHSFRFDHHQFQQRMRNAFEPRKPRHRLLRFAVGLIGLGLLALLVMFSVVIGAAMIAAGIVYKLWKRRGKPVAARDPRIVEGEFRVVDAARLERRDTTRPL
ncbi:hypothetical protein [Lysobacter silvisoli]|uniref:Uncharacterized protein n=1 Tax=Lysobacter silvisoli TaxID=2293254 RepID=A0A371K6E3_9GAMM|nr:hypothetical protein [Lysobacter silvisoli]RDZ29529.1 hypothetical protein DX914_10770 [Lysobacter silvisoli]